MTYVLATTESIVRWYAVKLNKLEDIYHLQPGDFELLDKLDIQLVPGFGNKATAKRVALAIGLKTWRYVKFDSPQQIFTFVGA